MKSGQQPQRSSDGALQGLSVPPADGWALGNIGLHAKARLWRGRGLTVGASGLVVVPTATDGQFTGSDKAALRVLALGAYTPAALARRLTVSASVGPIVRGTSEYANIVEHSGVAWGGSGSFRVLDGLWATAEMFGETTPSGQRQPSGAMA